MPCWVDRVVAVGFFCALRARIGISIACKADVQEAVVLRAGCCSRVNSVAVPLGREAEGVVFLFHCYCPFLLRRGS